MDRQSLVQDHVWVAQLEAEQENWPLIHKTPVGAVLDLPARGHVCEHTRPVCPGQKPLPEAMVPVAEMSLKTWSGLG